MPTISIVIPAKNESPNIVPLVTEIRAAMDGRHDYELIYVDDGSTDDTVAQLLALRQAGFQALRVMRHARSHGQSTAVRTGVQAALGQWIVTLDADGQNDPADVPSLLARVLDPQRDPRLQLIAGWRRKRRDTLVKRWSSRIANWVRRRLLHDGTPDTGCGLKVFSRELFLGMPYFDHMHRYLPALTQRAGAKVAVVEVNHRPRTRGTSKYGIGNRLWVGIVDLMGVMWLLRRAHVPDVSEER